MFIGVGTVANVATVVIGGSAGMLVGHLLGEHTRRIITDALGLVTLIIAGQATIAVFDPVLADYVGSSAPMLILLGARSEEHTSELQSRGQLVCRLLLDK